jgi:4-amino-4-deoxy-L-arabinose transferase-like glycosyltransferase
MPGISFYGQKIKMFSYLRQTNPARIAVFLLFALTCYRLWFATRLDLVPDEAYYWLWSKHLAACYRDKGPAIAWTIALGTKIFGDTVFGVRFLGVLVSACTGGLLFVLARRMYDDRVALWCLVTAAVMPIMAVGSILMTIDTLSVFFWALALVLFWNALHGGKTLEWFWLGLAIGAGFLAKFTNGVQLGCIAMFLLWSKEHRPLLFGRKMLIMSMAFLLSITPIIWWNVQTGWVNLMALHSRSGVTNSFAIHPGQEFKFLLQQFGILSPLFMAGMMVAAVVLTWKKHSDLRTRFLLSQFLPVYGLFMFFSLNSAGKPNWIAPALITGIILTVVFWREMISRRSAWRWGVGAAFVIALAMTVVLHDTDYLHLPYKKDPLRRVKGWHDFAAHVQQARQKYRASLLIANTYDQASMMAFYLPDHPVTYLLPAPYGATQFTLWPGYRVQPDTRALYVTDSLGPVPEILDKQFRKVDLVDAFWSRHHGRPMFHFRIYFCTPDNR